MLRLNGGRIQAVSAFFQSWTCILLLFGGRIRALSVFFFSCQYAACGVVREGSLVYVLTLSCCTEGTYCEECVVIRLCTHVDVRN